MTSGTNNSQPPDRVAALASCEGMVKKLAWCYARGDQDLAQDLEQEARIGLITAADRFEPGRGLKFITYAAELARGEIRHYLRGQGRTIRTPAWVQALLHRVTKERDALEQDTGSNPSPTAIAQRLGIPESEVENLLGVEERGKTISLDAPREEHEQNQLEKALIDAQRETGLPVEDRLFIEGLIARLPRREGEVVKLFFYGDLTQSEIGRFLGVSPNCVGYRLRGALSRLRVAGEECETERQGFAGVAPEQHGRGEVRRTPFPRSCKASQSSLRSGVGLRRPAPQP